MRCAWFHVYGGGVYGVDPGRWRAAGDVRVPFLGGFGWGAWVVVVDIGRRELRDGAVLHAWSQGGVRSIVRCRWEGGWVSETMGGRVLLDEVLFHSSVWGEVVWVSGRSLDIGLGEVGG